MNNKAVYMSINPNATQKIVNQIKNHEFRNYIPKQPFNMIFVYVTAPISSLKYIIKINQFIKHPSLIKYEGDGNDEFNSGHKSKYAYEIHSVYEISNNMPLSLLKKEYDFTPPQSFAYDSSYETLTNYILNSKLKLLFTNKRIEGESNGK